MSDGRFASRLFWLTWGLKVAACLLIVIMFALMAWDFVQHREIAPPPLLAAAILSLWALQLPVWGLHRFLIKRSRPKAAK